jgi:2-oxoglutarate ferredoxin oxidoreductase subunit alpha
MSSTRKNPDGQIALAIIGSGGAGVMTAAELLLRAAAKAGLYGHMSKSFGPQIRGGEAAAFITLASTPVTAAVDAYDLVLAIDWANAERFLDELPLATGSILVSLAGLDDAPKVLSASVAHRHEIDFKALKKADKTLRPNMLALGILAAWLNLPNTIVEGCIKKRFASRDGGATAQSLGGVAVGREQAVGLPAAPAIVPTGDSDEDRLLISGNAATGLGAVRGGIRFAAAYPITPATEILEWLAPRLKRLGGQLVQAEDELSSINMTIGASYGGLPSLTATSGPGLALMSESIGLAVSSEVPIVIVDVMRAGPSTGIPTRSEQTDLNIAVYGLAGEAPHLVTAPLSIADCVFTTQWSTHLAESLQTPVIVLSDQAIGQSLAVIDRPANIAFATQRLVEREPAVDYCRYAVTAGGVSPMALPGTRNGQYTADGLEHAPRGTPSGSARDHHAQLEKRARKLEDFDYGHHWAVEDGTGALAVVTWGSSYGPVLAAARRLDPEGKRIRVVGLRLIAPAQPEKLTAALAGCEQVLVVEQSHSGQFAAYLRAHYGLAAVKTYCRAGPLPLRPGELANVIEEALT